MNRIFNLLVAQWVAGKTWVMLFLALGFGAWVAPGLVPWQIDPGLTAFARAQILYAVTFLVGFIVIPVVAAEAGRSQVTHNHRLFWRALGVRDPQYFAAVCAACLVVAAAIAAVGFGSVLALGPSELQFGSSVQTFVLTALGFGVSIPIVVGLSQYISSAPAALLGIVFNVIGYYGPASVNAARSLPTNPEHERLAWEALFVLLPQLRLADQAERVTFAWPAIPAGAFASSVAYLAVWILISGAFGYALWRRR